MLQRRVSTAHMGNFIPEPGSFRLQVAAVASREWQAHNSVWPCHQPGRKVKKLLRSGLLVAAAVVGLAVVAQAQDSPQRKELRRVDLSGAAGMEVVSSISEFKPGEELPRHLHHGVEAGYVVQGTMVQNPGQQPAMLATGAPILNLRDVVHGGFKVVGPGNLILFTVHTVDKGKPLYDWAK